MQTGAESTAGQSDAQGPKRRWYRLTPDRLLMALLPIEGLLLLSERFRWFAFNEHKNWTVLIALAVVCLGGVLLLLWFAVSLAVRRRFQFSIRSLMLFVAVVAVACSWFTVKMQEARRQKMAVEALQRPGGGLSIYYYEIDADGNVPGTLQPPGPPWLRNLLGVDFLSDVLSIESDQSTDAELVHLKELTNLKQLILHAQVTGAGLVHLKGLPNLQELWMGGTEVTDTGLMHLEGLTSLQLLRLGNTKVSDAGLVHLKGLTGLQDLTLAGTKVTDAGLVHLKGLRSLQYLSLGNTRVSDAGLVHLKELTNLESLWLYSTQVTDAGVEDLRKALPNCHISR